MRKCTIEIMPDERCRANVETGAVTNLEILDSLKALMIHFSKAVMADYTEVTGRDPNTNTADFDAWVKFLRDSKL